MGITYSGGVLTQASEAGKTISAVASMTDGIRLTITSHGYSAGDAILITGTTSYNGDWIVSSVYDSNNIDIVSQYFPTGSALAYVSSQTGTSAKGDKNLAALTGLTGVTVINSGTDKVIYSISSSVTTLNINGLLKIDPDKELLILSASTVVVQTGYFVYGKRYTLNGFTKYSSSLGIITEKSGYKDSTSSAHWWVKNGSTFRTFGGRMELAGCIYFGTDVTANDNTIYIDIGNGEKTEFYCTNAENNLTHILRIFAVASNVKVNIILSGNITPDCVFSTNGFNAFSAELRLASFICDANDKATDPVTVTDAVFANNKADRDYSFQIALHSSTHLGLLTRMNKYIFINPDVGSLLRTFPAPDPSWDTPRMGCVEIYRAVKFVLTDSSGNAISAFRIYTEFVGASLNPASGSRYYGIDDYVTPRTLNVVGSSGETTPTNVLYAVAQGYTNTPYDTALTMDSLTSNANDAQTFFTVAYGFLSSLLSSSLRGIGTLSKSGTILPDVGITQATKATVAGYTGLSPVYSGGVLTITVSANHTWNEVYDYIKYWESENPASVWANDKTSFVSTSNKLSYVYSNLVVVVDGYDLITSALQVLPTKPTVSSGGFFEDAEGAIWESSGSIYYASHYYGHVVAVEDSADLEAVAIGYGDCATGTYLLYDMDLTLTGLVTDADGLAEGYMVWKVNSTTYADKAMIFTEYARVGSKVPRTLSGLPVGSSASPEVTRMTLDAEVTKTKANALAVSGITPYHSTKHLDMGDNTLSDVYDHSKAKQGTIAAWEAGVSGCMSFGLYGLILAKSGMNFNGKSDWIYLNLAGGGTIATGTYEMDLAEAFDATIGTLTIEFTEAGSYNYGSKTFVGTVTLVNSSGGAVTVQMPAGVDIVNTGPDITVVEPQIYQSVTVSGIATGYRIFLRDETSDTVLVNEIATGASFTWTDPDPAVADRAQLLRISYVDGVTAKTFLEVNIGTCGQTDGTKSISYLANITDDTVYDTNGEDGQSVIDDGEITFTDAAVDTINMDMSSGEMSLQRMYAAWVAYAFSEEGIETDIDYIRAIDTANYVFSNLLWKNISDPTAPLKIIGGYAWDSVTEDPIDLVDTTGGTIFLAPPHVVAKTITVTGGNVITGDISDVPTAAEIAAEVKATASSLGIISGSTVIQV